MQSSLFPRASPRLSTEPAAESEEEEQQPPPAVMSRRRQSCAAAPNALLQETRHGAAGLLILNKSPILQEPSGGLVWTSPRQPDAAPEKWGSVRRQKPAPTPSMQTWHEPPLQQHIPHKIQYCISQAVAKVRFNGRPLTFQGRASGERAPQLHRRPRANLGAEPRSHCSTRYASPGF